MSEAQRKSRIFVVDDEFIIASTLATILQRNGFRATSFTSPVEALKAITAEPPDLLISDVVMPELSGIDLAISVRENHPECRILLFSGQAATANLLEAARRRGYDFEVLNKPIHPTDFLARIRKVSEMA